MIDIEPIGSRITPSADDSLLDAIQSAGIEVTSVCGGQGWCGKCRIQIRSGPVSDPTDDEREALTDNEIKAGWRLACQTYPRGDVKINIPPDTLATAQRLQLEGQDGQKGGDPVIRGVDLELPLPDLTDLRSDTTRLVDALRTTGTSAPVIHLFAARQLAEQMRTNEGRIRAVLRDQDVIAVLPFGTPLLGFAVDLGTTKIASYLVNLEDGRTLAMAGTPNPQISYGEDVVSRIAYADNNGGQTLQTEVVNSLNGLIADLCQQAGSQPDQIVEAVIVGNTAMHHLLLGLPSTSLGRAPYVAAVNEALHVSARDIGLHISPGAYLFVPPNIAGYVGGDHTAMLLATETGRSGGTVVALDIGTNTEISLAVGNNLLTCSCASGPAFEGAHIRNGMRAAPGAIEHVKIRDGKPYLQTIDHQPPVGICGSGMLDVVAELLHAGLLNPMGKISSGSLTLVEAAQAGHGREIAVNREDVYQIQLAKAAIRAGIDILLMEAGLTALDIDQFIIAGAFGTYLDIESAVEIGMFPRLPLERFQQVGNAAGSGARQMLVSKQARQQAIDLIAAIHYIELTTHKQFEEVYVSALMFEV